MYLSHCCLLPISSTSCLALALLPKLPYMPNLIFNPDSSKISTSPSAYEENHSSKDVKILSDGYTFNALVFPNVNRQVVF